jgi:hypothetical protein
MTVCAGVAQLDLACGWEEMMRRADTAMYEAKRRGRNLVSACSEAALCSDCNADDAQLEKLGLLPIA